MSQRLLDGDLRRAEILFGLIMVLTFTCSLGVAGAGREDVRVMLIGALGCNLAWGIIDGVFYLMNSLAEKGGGLLKLQAVRRAEDPRLAQQLIADSLPAVVASVMEPAELETIRQRLRQLPEPGRDAAGLDRKDWLSALAVALLVFLTTFPVALPFLFMQEATTALRVSNAIAIAMLFIIGWLYGRGIGRSPWLFGVSMVLLGAALVAIAIALGG
ncbi:MAG: VIT family protein [Lysobacterales bacterium]|nr:MAG: VIT family protein [Xanthomonadales bacterium]